jgi:hypothetical protein
MDRALSCTVIVLFVVAPAAGPSTVAAQEIPQISESRNRYESESRYGKPQDFSLDENIDTWPEGQSIRVVGTLNPTEAARQDLRLPLSGEPRSSSTPRTYVIQSEDNWYSLRMTPVPEVAGRMDDYAPSWSGRKVEVVGVFPRRSAADGEIRLSPSSGRTFLFWSMLALPEEKKDDFDAPRSTIEALVMDREAAAGRVVAVTGTYRGGNLLEDLPDDSRRDRQDWVLNDGPFSIWVTGRKPKGEGFSFDLRSQSDLRWKLTVQGEVEIHDGYIYLRAAKVHLVGPAKEEAASR